jgi:hypothetical protein
VKVTLAPSVAGEPEGAIAVTVATELIQRSGMDGRDVVTGGSLRDLGSDSVVTGWRGLRGCSRVGNDDVVARG